MSVPPSQRPPSTNLGYKIGAWLEGVWDWIGLKSWTDKTRRRNRDWAAIQTVGDLEAWMEEYGELRPQALAFKAKRLGASDEDIQKLLTPGHTTILEDPSVWLSGQLQAAFKTPAWAEFNEIMGAVAIDPFLASLIGDKLPPDAPELETIRRFLGTVTAFETLGGLLTNLVETLSGGQIDNAGKMFTDLKWSLGICFTSWQTTSPIVESVVLKPLQRLINLTFRETDFTRSQWQDLYALGKITPSRLGAELGRLGYSDEKITWLLDLAKKQPSRSDLVGMWKKGIITEALVVDGFRKQGYDQVWIDRFLRYYQQDATTEEKGAYLGTLRKAFKEQLIGETELRDALKQQKRSDTAINLEIAVLKLGWEVDERLAAKSDIRKAFFEGIIGRPEAERWLADADFSAHTIGLLLDTWDKEKAPTYRKINKSELLKAWASGVLTQPQTYQGLLDVGYDSRGATVLMETYRRTSMQVKPPVVYVLRPQDVMWAWHTVVIEEGEAIERLIDLGLSEEDADLVFLTFQRLHPRIVAEEPMELRKNDILEAWGRGVLAEEETLDKLVGVGYIEEDAIILMRSYALRPEALPPVPSIAALIGATRRGVIDQAVLSQKLTVMGLRAEDVQFYVSYATTPLPETTRSLSRTDILKLWTEGRHDRAWALERLLALKYSPEDVEDILWLASPEIEGTETYILWTADLIDSDIATAMWLTMGFTMDQISEAMGAE